MGLQELAAVLLEPAEQIGESRPCAIEHRLFLALRQIDAEPLQRERHPIYPRGRGERRSYEDRERIEQLAARNRIVRRRREQADREIVGAIRKPLAGAESR